MMIFFEEKEAEINKEPKKREQPKETKEMSEEIEKLKVLLKKSQGIEDYMLIKDCVHFPISNSSQSSRCQR